jgi:hypothetical protein
MLSSAYDDFTFLAMMAGRTLHAPPPQHAFPSDKAVILKRPEEVANERFAVLLDPTKVVVIDFNECADAHLGTTSPLIFLRSVGCLSLEGLRMPKCLVFIR